MVKLIVSDIDGTLIPYGESAFSPRLFPLIRRLLDKGIIFCPASGRQLHSLRQLFTPLVTELPMLCENGAMVFGPSAREEDSPLLGKIPMPRADALAIAREIMAHPECRLVISGANTSYVLEEAFGRAITAAAGNHVTVIEDPAEISEDIFKVAAYSVEHIDALAREMAPRWGTAYAAAIAGIGWLDFSVADKGRGLRNLCGAYHVALSDTVAFGDNFNDLAMLKAAGKGYIMAGSHPDLLAQIPDHCADVCDVLEEILNSL